MIFSESIMDSIMWFSLIASIFSIILAIVAITTSKNLEKQTQNNLDRTQSFMQEQYDKTKDVLAEIDKRSTITENTVNESLNKISGATKKTVDESIVSNNQDLGDQLEFMLLQLIKQDPERGEKLIESLKPLIARDQ